MNIIKTLIIAAIVAIYSHDVFAQPSGISPFDTMQYGRNDKVGKYIPVRGFNIYYETYGQGEPLLIIHGNGGSINNFLYQ